MQNRNGIPDTGLRPPTYRLSSLLAAVALLCVSLALLRLLDPIWAGMCALLFLIVFAHVAGNALGTQLRENARWSQPLDEHQQTETRGRFQTPPTTRLSQRTRLGLGTLIPTALGVLTGACGGGWFLWWSMQGQVSIPSMALGVVSCGVLGGLWGFWMSSLISVLGNAIWHAHRDSND